MDKLLKNVVCILVFIFALSSVSVFATGDDKVVDLVDYLTDSEEEQLEQEINNLIGKHQHDIVIVITDDVKGKTSEAFADDYFDENGYGIGSDYTGILMLVDMENRWLQFSTCGQSIRVFDDARIKSMVSSVGPFLTAEDYNEACRVFLDEADGYLESGVKSDQYTQDESGNKDYYKNTKEYQDTRPSYFDKVLRNLGNIFFYIGALVITLIIIGGITLSHKGKVTINNRTYENGNSFKVTNRVDQYISQTTTRRKIQTNTSSGSGSSSHSSSSGSSHGGGGGGF